MVFKLDEAGKYTDFLAVISKNFFDLLKNVLAVATIKYLYLKSNSHVLGVAVFVCYGFLGIHVAAYLMKVGFKKELFADNVGAQTFRIALQLIIALPFMFLFSLLITILVETVSNLQITR